MKLTGFKAQAFEQITTMVDAHDGHFDGTDEGKNFIFAFKNPLDEIDCFNTIVSMNLMNVTLDKIDKLHLQVNI